MRHLRFASDAYKFHVSLISTTNQYYKSGILFKQPPSFRSMNSSGSLWLGYSRLGGRFAMKLDELGKGVAILGHGANELAPLVALACEEAGMKALILDIDGTVADRLSGYMDEYDAAYFLYDSMRIEEAANVHAQLAASAYACALDLSFEQEASLNSMMQIIANERGIASPVSLADLIQSPDTAKARTID